MTKALMLDQLNEKLTRAKATTVTVTQSSEIDPDHAITLEVVADIIQDCKELTEQLKAA